MDDVRLLNTIPVPVRLAFALLGKSLQIRWRELIGATGRHIAAQDQATREAR